MKHYCSYCGEEATPEHIHDGEFVCPTCHSDMWDSELIPADELRVTKWPIKELMTPAQIAGKTWMK